MTQKPSSHAARPADLDPAGRRPDRGRRVHDRERSLRRPPARRASSAAARRRRTARSGASSRRSDKMEVPRLDAAAPFTPKDNIVPIEISEYAGYAGLIAANGGLDPSENSVFFKNHGFKVKLSISEDESWSDLNPGKIAGVGHDGGRARGLRTPVPRRGAGADRLFARRRRPRRAQRDQEDQRSQGQDRRDRRSSPKPTSSCAISRRKPASKVNMLGSLDATPSARSHEPGLHRRRFAGRRAVPRAISSRDATSWRAA